MNDNNMDNKEAAQTEQSDNPETEVFDTPELSNSEMTDATQSSPEKTEVVQNDAEMPEAVQHDEEETDVFQNDMDTPYYVPHNNVSSNGETKRINNEKKSKATGIVAMILGILAIILFCVPGVGQILALAALIVGINSAVKGKGRKMGITGIILGAISIVATIVMILISSGVFERKDLNKEMMSNAAWQRIDDGSVLYLYNDGTFIHVDQAGVFTDNFYAGTYNILDYDDAKLDFSAIEKKYNTDYAYDVYLYVNQYVNNGVESENIVGTIRCLYIFDRKYEDGDVISMCSHDSGSYSEVSAAKRIDIAYPTIGNRYEPAETTETDTTTEADETTESETEAQTEDKNTEASTEKTETGDSEAATEASTEKTEATTEASTEKTEATTEASTERVTTEATTEASTERVTTETTTEASTEHVTTETTTENTTESTTESGTEATTETTTEATTEETTGETSEDASTEEITTESDTEESTEGTSEDDGFGDWEEEASSAVDEIEDAIDDIDEEAINDFIEFIKNIWKSIWDFFMNL